MMQFQSFFQEFSRFTECVFEMWVCAQCKLNTWLNLLKTIEKLMLHD